MELLGLEEWAKVKPGRRGKVHHGWTGGRKMTTFKRGSKR